MTDSILNHTLAPVLRSQAMTYTEMMEATGYSRPGITNWLRTQVTHVPEWAPDGLGRMVVPKFKLGRGQNAPRPAAKTGAERMRQHRAQRDAT